MGYFLNGNTHVLKESRECGRGTPRHQELHLYVSLLPFACPWFLAISERQFSPKFDSYRVKLSLPSSHECFITRGRKLIIIDDIREEMDEFK